MGTRHLIAVKFNGEYRIANYGQWDGYPDGQGVDVLKFARKISDSRNRAQFEEKLVAVEFATGEYLESIDEIDNWAKEYPWLSRDAGSDILDWVYDMDLNNPIKLQNNIAFAGDGLFCEWGWIIDLDANTLEAYQGFQKEELAEYERFFGFSKTHPEYQPIKHLYTWPLAMLPDDDGFITMCNKKAGYEEEEEENADA